MQTLSEFTLRSFIEKINSEGNSTGKIRREIRYDEPMADHTTFKVGGKADVWLRPEKEAFSDFAALLLDSARKEGIPVFILGAGANIVVSDKGIRGIVLDTGSYSGIEIIEKNGEQEFLVNALSGTVVDSLVDDLAGQGLSGMEFLAGMPGSVGGTVWMNARCFEKSVSDVLVETEILDETCKRKIIPFMTSDFSYKKSPFQGKENLILSACFALQLREPKEIRKEADSHRRDRKEKGHYRFPSAGSVFKNNRDFRKPTGKIIDELGLRGLTVGGAQIAPWHGNIVINTGGATAKDIKTLMDEVARRVKEDRGLDLASEVLFAGDW